MNNFETLQILPQMEKNESGDYNYSQDFVGKIFHYNNLKNNTKELVYFYPNEKFIIPEIVFDAIIAKSLATNQTLNQVNTNKYLESSIFENQISDMTLILNNITSNINELGKKVSLSKDDILTLVRTELNMVKSNFENVMKTFITDEIKKQLDTSTRDIKGKLDPKVLIKLADNGFTPDHLIEMGKAGLI